MNAFALTIHPYDPLSTDEIEQAVAAVRSARRELTALRFPMVRLDYPSKDSVRSAMPTPRAAFLVVYDRVAATTYEVRVDLAVRQVTSWELVPDVQPAIMIEEIMELDDIVKKDPRAVAALARHGVHDLTLLQLDPWSTGTLPIPGVSARRRVIRASA